MILFQLDKGAIENIDERLKESLSIYLKRKEKLQFLKKALYFAPTSATNQDCYSNIKET